MIIMNPASFASIYRPLRRTPVRSVNLFSITHHSLLVTYHA